MPKPPGREWIDAVDDDTFDTLARPGIPGRPGRPSQTPTRPSRHSRNSQNSQHSRQESPNKGRRGSERSQLQYPGRAQAESYQDWRQAQEAAARAIRAAEPPKKKKTRFYSRLRICLVVFFLGGYIALVSVLVSAIVTGRSGGEGCQKLCPLSTRCQLEAGEERCVASSGANVATMELILWIVVGVPSLICIPCLCQCILRRCCPKWWERLTSRSSSAYQADSEVLGAMLGKPQPQADIEPPESGNEADQADEARSISSPRKPQTPEAAEPKAAPEIQDDGLNELFTPLAKSQPPKASAVEEEELDLLFAPKPRAQQEMEKAPVKGPPKPPSTDLESAFSHLFHKRAILRAKAPKVSKPAAQPARPGSELRSDFSAGMSVLFATVQRSLKAKASSRVAQEEGEQSTIVDARAQSEIGNGDVLVDDELGDPPDFFGYAVRLARSVEGAKSHLHDSDAASDSDDSLGHLEPSDLLDLFHPPLDGW